jgi:hypothetical protein
LSDQVSGRISGIRPLPDIRYPAFGLSGYPAGRISGENSIRCIPSSKQNLIRIHNTDTINFSINSCCPPKSTRKFGSALSEMGKFNFKRSDNIRKLYTGTGNQFVGGEPHITVKRAIKTKNSCATVSRTTRGPGGGPTRPNII